MSVYAVYIVSKSGSLLYQVDSASPDSPLSPQTSNDYLVIAGNLHGIHTIASKLTPSGASRTQPTTAATSNINTESNKTGLRVVYTDDFAIHLHQTVTGLKIIIISQSNVDDSIIGNIQIKIWNDYCDYVMKNPFYNIGMPIRVGLDLNKLLV